MTTRTWTIGSDASCDLVIPNKIVSGKHCQLTVNAGRLTLTDLESTNGTFVNGKRLKGSMVVSTSHQVTLGTSLAMPWPKEIIQSKRAAHSPKRPEGVSPKKRATKVITIGRAEDNSIVLDDSNVSSHHARMIIGRNQIVLEDLGSTNGTAVGQIENNISRAIVRKQDTVFFGLSAFRVSQLLNFRHTSPEAIPVTQVSTQLFSELSKLPLVFAGLGMAAAVVGVSWLFFINSGASDQQVAQATNSSARAVGSSGEATEAHGNPQSETNTTRGDERFLATPTGELEPATKANIAPKTDSHPINDTASETPEKEAPTALADSEMSTVESESPPSFATPPTIEKPRGFRMWRISAGQVVSAKLLDIGAGQTRLQRQNGSELTVGFDKMNPEDIDYLRGVIWPGKEEMNFHEALEQGIIHARTEHYAHDSLQIIVSSIGNAITPEIRVASGTWVELDQHPRLGRIYLATKERGAPLRVDSWNRTQNCFSSVDGFSAIPVNWEHKIPVIESYTEGTKVIRVGYSQISRAGFDPLVETSLTTPTSMKDGNDVLMSQAAAVWMMDNPNLKLSTFQNTVSNIFANRMTTTMKRAVARFGGAERFERRNAWNPTIDHLKMAEHLLERAKFDLATDEKVFTAGDMADGVSGIDVAGRKNRGGSAAEHDTLALADALDAGVVRVAGRKGLDGRIMVALTRGETAPTGPMHIKIPVGTVLLVDDGKPEPMQCYALYDQRIDLFGPVSGGAQVPVLYGSYKRKIKTTKELAIQARYDSKIADLFADRPPAHYLQMAVEAVLMNEPELNRDQVQDHLNLTGVPISDADSTREPIHVSEALFAAAKLRISGDKSTVAAEIAGASKTNPDQQTSGADGRKDPLPVADKSSLPSPKPSGDPPELDLVKSEEGDRARKLLTELNQYVPESPEDDLLGTWESVPDNEAREIAESLMLNYYKRAALAQGKTLSDDEMRKLKSTVQQELRGLRVLTGSITFEIRETGLKRFSGKLLCRKPNLSMNLAGSWHLDGNGFSMGRSGGTHYTVERLEYAAEGRLAQVRTFVGDSQGVTFGVLALKKVK